MICCAVLSMILALFVSIKTALAPARTNPLAWRPDGVDQAINPEEDLLRPFSIEARIRSFRYAGRGVGYLIRREHNAWIHVAAAAAVVALAAALRVSAADWRWLIISMTMVLAGEALNTAIERLCDVVSPCDNPRIGVVKDVAAGAVLMLAIGAALIGAITFAPHLFDWQGALSAYCGGGMR